MNWFRAYSLEINFKILYKNHIKISMNHEVINFKYIDIDAFKNELIMIPKTFFNNQNLMKHMGS